MDLETWSRLCQSWKCIHSDANKQKWFYWWEFQSWRGTLTHFREFCMQTRFKYTITGLLLKRDPGDHDCTEIRWKMSQHYLEIDDLKVTCFFVLFLKYHLFRIWIKSIYTWCRHMFLLGISFIIIYTNRFNW